MGEKRGLTGLTRSVRANDVFVLVTLEEGRLFNVDGVGRGEGWAGNVTLRPADEPLLSRAVEERIVVIDGVHPRRVFGPYWARRAAAVAQGDSVVVFGGADLDTTADRLVETAAAIEEAALDSVRPTKLEADRAEIDQARRSILELEEVGSTDRAEQLATAAATALGCEYAAVYLPKESPTPFIADQGWRPVASPGEVAAAMVPLWQAAKRGPIVEQDVSRSALVHRPLGWTDGVVSLAAASLGENGDAGVLVAVHTGISPRGFTDLCTRVLQTMGEAGTAVLNPL